MKVKRFQLPIKHYRSCSLSTIQSRLVSLFQKRCNVLLSFLVDCPLLYIIELSIMILVIQIKLFGWVYHFYLMKKKHSIILINGENRFGNYLLIFFFLTLYPNFLIRGWRLVIGNKHQLQLLDVIYLVGHFHFKEMYLLKLM